MWYTVSEHERGYMRIKLHARNIDRKFRTALKVCVEHTLNELKVSKRMRDNLSINVHLRHHSCEGEAKISEWTNRYRPREFDIIIDHHRLTFDEYGREKGETEWAHDVLKTLCHELVHVSDYVSGELTWRDRGLLWKGEWFDVKTMSDYFKLPYEIRAYGMEKGLLLSFLDFWKECEDVLGL